MERSPVTSSSLRSVGYDPLTETLEIELQSGAVYQYSAVPQAVFTQLMSASSIGSYFHAHIRDTYNWVRMSS
jgi:hypothetical protein